MTEKQHRPAAKKTVITLLAVIFIAASAVGCAAEQGNTARLTYEGTDGYLEGWVTLHELEKRLDIFVQNHTGQYFTADMFWDLYQKTEDGQWTVVKVTPTEEWVDFPADSVVFPQKDEGTSTYVFHIDLTDATLGEGAYRVKTWASWPDGETFSLILEFTVGRNSEIRMNGEANLSEPMPQVIQPNDDTPGGEVMGEDPQTEPADPEAALIAQFQELLYWDGGETCYNGALTCVYDSPEDINLYYVFYNQFPDGEEWSDFTAEEQEYLIREGAKKNLQFDHFPAQKRPAQQLDALLQQYFGVSLSEVQIPDSWVYYEATDSYYTNHSSVHVMEGRFFTVTGVEYDEDGLIYVYYTAEGPIFRQDGTSLEGWEHDMVLTLRANGDGYVAVANQPLEVFQPPDLQEVINRILVGGLSYDDTWRSMGQYTLTATQADGRVDTYVCEPAVFSSLGLTPGYQVANNYGWTQVDESQWTGLEGNEYSFRFANERYALTVYSHEEKMELQVDGVTLYFVGTPVSGESNGGTMYVRFRQYAKTALRQYERDVCQVSGSETDYALVAQSLAEQHAKIVLERPQWADFRAIDFRICSTEVYDAYYGQDMPNFGFRMTYYLKVTEQQRDFWETGSGLTEPSGSSPYGDYFSDGRQVHVKKGEDGNWHMSGMVTGGACAGLPISLDEATTQQLMELYFLTEGHTHVRIFLRLGARPLEEIKAQLDELEPDQREELTSALLEFVTTYPDYAGWKAEDF